MLQHIVLHIVVVVVGHTTDEKLLLILYMGRHPHSHRIRCLFLSLFYLVEERSRVVPRFFRLIDHVPAGVSTPAKRRALHTKLSHVLVNIYTNK